MTNTGSLPWVDLLCVLVLAAYGFAGLRNGFIATTFSLAGFLAGGVLALLVVPPVRDLVPSSSDHLWLQPLLVIVLCLLMGLLGQFVGGVLGRRLTRDLQDGPLYWANGVGGLVVALATTAITLWLVGGAVRSMSAGGLSSAVSSSRILTTIDGHMPSPVSQAASALRVRVVAAGLPQVFSGLAPEPIAPAPAADPRAVDPDKVADIQAAVVRIDGTAGKCGTNLEGSGWLYAPGRVVTNAHVVAGTDAIRVSSGIVNVMAQVVLFDPDLDVAVLAVEGLDVAPVPLGTPLESEGKGAVLGYPLAGELHNEPVTVRSVLQARGWDIYGHDPVVREVYSLRGVVQPGNSGGPLVDTQARAVGLVFARSLDDPETGYAISLAQITPDLQAGQNNTSPLDTGACVRL